MKNDRIMSKHCLLGENMKKIIILSIFVLLLVLSVGFSFAYPNPETFHEMNGTIVDRDVSGQAIDYLINISGNIVFLSCEHQPFEEFNIGDNVTMNGTIDNDSFQNLHNSDFGGRYDGKKYPNLVLNDVVVNQHTYGQMRLINDINNEYYYN